MAACDLLETIPIRVSGIADRLSFHCGTVEDFSKERNQGMSPKPLSNPQAWPSNKNLGVGVINVWRDLAFKCSTVINGDRVVTRGARVILKTPPELLSSSCSSKDLVDLVCHTSLMSLWFSCYIGYRSSCIPESSGCSLSESLHLRNTFERSTKWPWSCSTWSIEDCTAFLYVRQISLEPGGGGGGGGVKITKDGTCRKGEQHC